MRYVIALAMAWASNAQADPAICEASATEAAAAHDVPPDVLHAITLTETGRTRDDAFRPWPWTINLEGQGHWFDDRQSAEAFARQALSDGRTSFDVGCFQLNWRWHGEYFGTVTAMFDPSANADYAARYLASHYAERGDWSAAAGRYHSGTPEHARRYRARFDTIRADLPTQIAEALEPPVPASPVRTASTSGLLTRATGPLLRRATGPLGGR
ncbi:lytic transglycosylase domain-containing protein [Roseobacter sp. HKCCA0434]|uniref:lytic transglycosylase domain-containing protein n=1 Tax=Roseobacter sp. HKCCA0434 TaxID=3079297 RepID=UPI002905C6A8|nr:lytic transglycosylase domain-containing protein [Roseobacter sp. HKCCA0434]